MKIKTEVWKEIQDDRIYLIPPLDEIRDDENEYTARLRHIRENPKMYGVIKITKKGEG